LLEGAVFFPLPTLGVELAETRQPELLNQVERKTALLLPFAKGTGERSKNRLCSAV